MLAYLGEHVSRSKTPIVDALLVLYPTFAAALTLHQVQLFCAQGAQTAQRQGRAAASALLVQQVVYLWTKHAETAGCG